MESRKIHQDLLITLEILNVREIPALIEEVVHFFINTHKTPVANQVVASTLKDLESSGEVYTNGEGFVSFSKDINSLIENRFKLEEITRERIKRAKRVLVFLEKFAFIKFIGAVGESPLGRIGKGEKIKLIVIADKESSGFARFIINNYLKLRFSLKNFQIEKIFEIDNLVWDHYHPKDGIKLLNLVPMVNKDKFHEKFLGSNNWIFELFSNYPLEKVSWGFRMSKNVESETSGFVRALNSWLTPKKD